jgi:hypothetical protein
MILQIKRGNRVIAESADFSYSPSLQEVRKLTCEVVSVVPIEFKAYNSKSESEYDTVVYNGNTFILYQAPSGDNLNEAGKYKYSLLFYGKEVLLQNVAFLDIVSGTGGEINKIRYTHGGLFQFWGDAKQLAARIEANIESYNASLGAGYTGIGTWTLNVDAEGELTEDMIDITDGINLFEALKFFYDKFYLNYYFSTTANGGIITITDKTRPSVNWIFKQGDGGGAVKVSSSVDTSTPVITRIIPQGGSRNVPPEYKKDAKPADESRYCPYILLPNDSAGNIRYFIDSEYGLKNYGVRGKTISNTFSGIYPSIRGKKLGDLYPSGLPEWDTYKTDGEPDPQSGKVAGEGASASTRIDKIIGSTPIKSDDSDSFFIYMTSPGFNLGYKVYEDGDSSDKINDNVQPQYKPHAMFDKYRDFERFDIYGTRAYYDQPVKVTASFLGKMFFSVLPIGSDAIGKKVKIHLRMVFNRVLGQASPLKEVVIGEEGATSMLEIPYDKTALVGYIEKGQNTTVTIRVEFTFDSDVPAGSCKIGFSEEMTCNIHFGNQDGLQDRFYYKYASVTDAVFSMRTGTYTGTEFKINKNGIIPLYGEVNGDTGETEEDVAMFNKGARYKILCYRTDSDNAKLPLYTDGKSPSIAAGTEFVILNIIMPESYVTMAENTLEKAALDYLSRYDHENRTVSLDISSGFVAEHPNLFIDFIEGNMLKVRDDGIGVFDFSDNGQIVDMQLQIQSLEIKYSKENMFPSYSCTIARKKILSFYERLAQENQTASTQNTTNVTLGGSGTGSGTNIFSEQLLNDLIASFQKFNGWFEWDEEKQALRCKSAFYTNQWISALGVSPGGSGGSGGDGLVKNVYGFSNLGTTFSDSDIDNTFNAYTINEIWKMAKEGGGIKNITQSGSGNAVTNMALSSDGKTITAVFGETFARQQDLGTLNNTVTQLSNKLNNFLEGSDADNIINKWKELEAFLDGLTESDKLADLLALKADKTITISAGAGLTGGGNLSANRTISLATSGVKAGTYTKVTVDTYGRVTVGDNPTTLAGYGITDAYTQVQADKKFVTLATDQAITGNKTFTNFIRINDTKGLSYSGNTVFRNSSGNTVISSFGDGMIYFRPNGDTSGVGVIQINKQGHLNGVSAGFTGGVSAARLTANEYIQIGDAQLVYDSANKALRVKHRTDGNTVGFYSDGWVSALGVKTSGSGGGSGVIKTVYSFANLTDGTTFSDSDIDNTFNAYTIKKLYDMAGQGGLDADAMWAELKKADSSKIIDASHIPTSVLDGRWVTISTNQNITGQKTFTQQLKSTVATGTAPLIVNSTTLVSNLNSNYLQGYNYLGFIHSNYSASTGGTSYVSGDTHMMLVAEINIDTIYSTYVILLSNEFWGHQHYSALQLHIACTNNDNSGNKSPKCSVHVMSLVGSRTRGVRYKIENNKAYIFIEVYGGNSYGRWASTILQNYDSKTTNNANTTGNITLRFAFNQANSGLSDASYVNYISSTGLATSRTLWGQPFNGTANVSGDMTGVGSITMSGDLKIGNATSPNTIYFYGTTGDGPGSYSHTFIAERLWRNKESSELVLFKGNDIGNGTDAITVSSPGPDRIRHIAAAHLFQTYTTSLLGSVESVCTSSALKNLFSIASNRVISYVQLQSTITSGTAPFIVASNTVVSNLNADLLDGLHENSFLRYRDAYGIDGYNTLWSQIGIRQYNNAKPDGMANPIYNYGAVVSLPASGPRLDIWYNHTSSASDYNTNGIQYRSGYNDDKKPWRMLLDSVNYASYSDGRYVKKSGDTMTGDLTMNSTKGFNIGWRIKVTKTSGVWIHGGTDAASSTDANLRFGSWYGIGWYPTYSGGNVARGNNAMWLNVRNGNLDTHGAIIAHTNFLAANWDSARRLVMGGGSTYVWIDSRNSSNNVLCNIVLLDNKVTISKYAESSRFVSTVGTGTAPYQCSSTTLNNNLNADLLDGYHAFGTSNALIKYGCTVGGTEPAWCRIATYSIRNTETMTDVCFVLHSAFNDLFGLLVVRTRGGGYVKGLLIASYNINTSNIRIYHDAEKRNIELYCHGGNDYSVIQANLLYSHDRSGWVNTNITLYREDTKAPSWSTYVNPVFAHLQNSSEAAKKLQTPRTLWGRSFDGTANIDGNLDNVGVITSKGGIWLDLKGSSGVTFYSGGSLSAVINSTGMGIGNTSPSQKLHVTGNIIATGAITAKASSSDIRLKTDIQDYDAMGIIRKFRSVKYHWNNLAKRNSEIFNHKKWNYGLIAQDLLSGGYSQWVSDIFKDYYTIDYERLIPVVWKGLQEVDDEVTRLKKRVRELENKLGIKN